MGNQSSNGKTAYTPEDALKITKILSESPQFEQSAKRMSSKRTSEKGLRPKEFLSEHQIAIRETNEAIDFVQDFVLLYSAPLQNGINFNTNPLLTIHVRTLGSSETLGDSRQNLYQSMASSGGRDNQPKLLRNKVKSIIQNTDQSAAELKNVLTDMNAQQKSRFSFARQRMDFHREPAKLAKVVGSSMPSYIARDNRDARDMHGSQNSSLNLALQAKGILKSSEVRNRDSPDSHREVNRSRNSPEAIRVRSSPQEAREVYRGRNSPEEYRQQEVREVYRDRNSPQEYQQQEAREIGRSRNSPQQYKQPEAPVFGDRVRESREYRDDRRYENVRREKKERDNKTHESLLILKDDIDRIKGDLQRSKSTTREPRRSNDKIFNADGSPSLSSYQGLTRDTKSPQRDPYQQQAQPRRVNEPAISVSTRQGYPQGPQKLPPYDREPNMYQSNPQYIQKESFGKNDNQLRTMKFSQPPPRDHREDDFAHQNQNQYYERPKSPMTADFAGPQRRNEYERPLARSQSPINDNRSQIHQFPVYQSQTITNLPNQNRSQAIINKQVAQKLDNRYISEPNHYAEREQGLNYGQVNVPKSNSQSQQQFPQKFVPTQPNHPNLLNLLTPQKSTPQQNEQFILNTQRSKLNFSGIVSDVNGSYSFDDDNEVQPVSMNLNLEDLLNDSQLHIPQKSNKGYQQPPQAKNHYPKSTVPSYHPNNDRNRNLPSNPYENQRYNDNQQRIQDHHHNNNYYSNPNPQRSENYDSRQARNQQPFDRRDNTGPNALFNLSESMIAKNDAYTLPSTDRDIEPVRRSKWDIGHGNGNGNGYSSARGQPQNNYQTNPVMTSGQYRKY